MVKGNVRVEERPLTHVFESWATVWLVLKGFFPSVRTIDVQTHTAHSCASEGLVHSAEDHGA